MLLFVRRAAGLAAAEAGRLMVMIRVAVLVLELAPPAGES